MTSRALSVLETGKRDLYYSDSSNGLTQAIPVEYNTRFTYEMSNKNSGVSVFLLPPGNAYRTPVLVLGYSSASLAGNTGGYALPRGWGYNAIKSLSVRVAGSTQMFWSGSQLLQRNTRLVRTASQADQILALGGNICVNATDFAQDQFSYIPISWWSGVSVDGLSLPLPADILSQSVQITVEINPPSAFWIANTNPGGLVGALPSGFTTGYLQTEQLVMADRAMSLANEPSFAGGEVSYSMPVYGGFDQQEQVISNLNASTDSQSVVLTGFRAGECKSIELYLVDKRSTNINKNYWRLPKAVSLLYTGVIYSQFNDGTSQIFNLIDGTKPSAFNTFTLTQPVAPGVMTVGTTPVLSQWVSLPFGQRTGEDFEANVISHGKEILNGVCNLQISLPTADAMPGGGSVYELHAVYVYNSALNFARGTCEWIF